MKIVVHDYAGHPFQVDLSRNLAKRGHTVYHLYFAGDQGPKGNMVDNNKKSNIFFEAIGSKDNYSKTNFFKRRMADLQYGKDIAIRLSEIKPDIVISGNTPTETQEIILRRCKNIRAKFIYWCQDFYSIAATSILKKKLSFIGALIGSYYQFLERRQMLESDHIVHITNKFCEQTAKWGIDDKKISVISNWGALDEINLHPKYNAWSKKNNLNENLDRVIYSGTMALKHNPVLIENLAKNNPNIEVLVIGSGVGVDYLQKLKSSIPNLIILPLQPFSEFDQVLSSGDVLVAVIEEDAGKFSVPSKILSYMCAGKPIVLAAPSENLASQIISQSHSGVVVDSIDKEGFSKAVYELITDKIRSDTMGRNARKYAEKNFNIKTITDSFESIFQSIVH